MWRAAAASQPEAFGLWERNRPCRYTAHVVGHVGDLAGSAPAEIRSVTELAPDESLKSAPLRIALGKLGVVDYPGGGTHVVLFDFAARHYAGAADVEELHYNVVIPASRGAAGRGAERTHLSSGSTRAPRASPCRVSPSTCGTSRMRNCSRCWNRARSAAGCTCCRRPSPRWLRCRRSPTASPRHSPRTTATFPSSPSCSALTSPRSAYGAVLRTGAYVVVQVPELQYAWDWAAWVYDARIGDIVSRTDPTGRPALQPRGVHGQPLRRLTPFTPH